MIDIYNIDLLDITPDSIKKDPLIQVLATVMSKELREVAHKISLLTLLPSINSLDEQVIDLLAWQMHVDFYDDTLPIEAKRELVKNSFVWHKFKGTKEAVEQVVSIIFKDAKVSEWFEYAGLPYHFKVVTNQTLAYGTDLNKLIQMVDATKNARSVLESVTINRSISSNRSYGGILNEQNAVTISIKPFKISPLPNNRSYGGIITEQNAVTISLPPFKISPLSNSRSYGGVVSEYKTITIYPRV